MGHHFRIPLPDSGQPWWWVDVLLLDTAVRDVLVAHSADIVLWRVHRRAVNDDTGHQFTFYCYAEADAHRAISHLLEGHTAVVFLRSSQLLVDYTFRDVGPELVATSDPSWPKPLQAAWPQYIMGVSAMALELLSSLPRDPVPVLDPAAVDECAAYFEHLAGEFNAVWQQHGSHAFFHHINAIFGYTPVLARPAHVEDMLALF